MNKRDIDSILKINNYLVSLDLDKGNNNEEKKRLAKKSLNKRISKVLNKNDD